MKPRLILVVVILCAMTSGAFAQSESTISLTDQGIFQLPDEGIKAVYTLNIEALDITTLQEGVEFFEDKNTEYVLFRPNPSFDTASVFILYEKRPEWTVADWNSYLANIILTNN